MNADDLQISGNKYKYSDCSLLLLSYESDSSDFRKELMQPN